MPHNFLRMIKLVIPVFLMAGVLATLGLTACTGGLVAGTALSVGVGYEYFKDPKVSMVEKSYAAADYMDQQTRNFIQKSETIKITRLKDSAHPGLETDVAVMIPEQVGMRFMQLGYTVDMQDVTPKASPNITNQKNGRTEYVLGGFYTQRGKEMDIRLRITGVDTNKLIASFDYTMPITWETRRQAKPDPVITRITP